MNAKTFSVLLLALSLLSPAADSKMPQSPPATVRMGAYTFKFSYHKQLIPKRQLFEWWGAFAEGKLEPVLSEISGKYKGKTLYIPRSAYADLVNILDISAGTAKAGCVLMISGGDAGVAFDAQIRFSRERVIERRVASGEFPDIRYEKTTYRYPRPGEID